MRFPKWAFLVLCCLGFARLAASPLSISIDLNPELAAATPLKAAIEDVRDLLEIACNCPVGFNLANAEVHLQLAEPTLPKGAKPMDFAAGRQYPYFKIPDHQYYWESRRQGKQIYLRLQSPSTLGLAHGLYGLLQEALAFYFVHPRETVFPCIDVWPLADDYTLEGIPKFDKKGFHLHTQHPTELTEALHNPQAKQGKEMVREYIRWLARNQQNFFEFCLLETVDLKHWQPYAKDIVQYAHQRGVLCSVDLSLHMIQQHAFKLVEFPPKNWMRLEKQIDSRLDLILAAGFDFINMEFSIAEFVGGFEKLRHRLRKYIVEKINEHPGVKLIGRTHVVKPGDEIGGSKKQGKVETADPERGNLIHTVMAYSLTDQNAPVYELENFQHLHDQLREENKVRETWYFPESAYWITYDNSIPLLLWPYLSARLQDIETARAMGIPGHVTFSSGWEWGYWMVDWSIARWSWEFTEQDILKRRDPLMAVEDLFDDDYFNHLLLKQMGTQEDMLDENTFRLLCPYSFSDDLPGGLDKQFQPRPEVHLKDLTLQDTVLIEGWVVELLWLKTQLTGSYLYQLPEKDAERMPGGLRDKLLIELATANEVMMGFVGHRIETFIALRYRLKENWKRMEKHLTKAAAIRETCQGMVEAMESQYRYPIDLIARPHESFTSYPYGYLYSVSNLHFWRRREEQIRQDKFGDPFFMNLFDPARIAGFRR